jgi:hypothetical protein
MTRRLTIVYTKRYLSQEEIKGKGTFSFLSNDDTLTVGDTITAKQYSNPMQIVEIVNDASPTLRGIRLSNVEIASIQRGPNYNPSEGDLQKEYERLLGTQALPAPVRQESTNATREASMLDGLNTFINSVLAGVSTKEIVDKVFPDIEQKIKDTYGFLPVVHEIKMPERTYKFTEPLHEKFDEVTAIISQDIPVYLTGKAGTGKNVICKQVAKALGLDFYFTNAVTQEYKLTGFIDANGTYQSTQFYQAFTKGGLFFLDEMDASIPETLVILNAAIANRYFDFPTGKVDAHPDFRVVAAGNTVGTGADSEYTGRYCLDEASLDRFAMVEITYSQQIEEALSKGDVELVNFAHTFRDITEKASLKCLFSYRTINRIAKLKDMLPLKEVLKISLLKGLDVDDINILKNEFKSRGGSSNTYSRAIMNY